MKLKNKIILGLGSVTTIVVPFTTVISCGNSSSEQKIKVTAPVKGDELVIHVSENPSMEELIRVGDALHEYIIFKGLNSWDCTLWKPSGSTWQKLDSTDWERWKNDWTNEKGSRKIEFFNSYSSAPKSTTFYEAIVINNNGRIWNK